MNNLKFILFLSLLLNVPLLQAKTAYVSDRLYLGLYSLPDTTGTPIKTLPSGSKVDIVEKQGDFVFIRLEDGSEGWARGDFISEQLPAKQKLNQLQKEFKAERDQWQIKLNAQSNNDDALKTTRSQLAKANKTITNLRGQLKATQSDVSSQSKQQQLESQQVVEALKSQLAETQQTTADLQEQVKLFEAKQGERSGNALTQILWVLFALVVCTGLGVAFGIRWMSNKIKQRFNGLKVW